MSDKEIYSGAATAGNLLWPLQPHDGEGVALGSPQYHFFPHNIPEPSSSHLFVFKAPSQEK